VRGYADHLDHDALRTRGRTPESNPMLAGGFAAGSPVATLLHLQRTAGNAAVNRLLRQYAGQSSAGRRGTSPASLMLQRCGAKACDCSPEEREAHDKSHVQEGAELLGPVQRLVVQRDDDDDPPDPPDHKDETKPRGLTDPGGGVDTGDKGFTCGVENGKPACHVDPGKGDPLNLPGQLPSTKPENQPDIGKQGACQPERWNPPSQKNLFKGRCCNVDQVYDQSAQNCVPAPKGKDAVTPAPDPGSVIGPPEADPDPIVVPPATPEEKGDFTTPEDDPDSQVA
jgi:hypothetical protein